jgi:hypothetical protein
LSPRAWRELPVYAAEKEVRMTISWITGRESSSWRWAGLTQALAASVCLVGLAGCGGSDVDLVRAEGTVTLDGQPVADAGVVFTPKKKELCLPAAGTTDASGRFALVTTNRPGAMLGKYRVVISKTELPDLPRGPDGKVDESRLHEMKEMTEVNYLPVRYASADTSDLEATVNATSNNFTFSLTSDETVTKSPESEAP